VWSLFGVCQSMLANPLSTAQADIDRRARVLQREVDFNAVLQSVCGQYSRCRYDAGAVFGTRFVASDITGRDDFHHRAGAGDREVGRGPLRPRLAQERDALARLDAEVDEAAGDLRACPAQLVVGDAVPFAVALEPLSLARAVKGR